MKIASHIVEFNKARLNFRDKVACRDAVQELFDPKRKGRAIIENAITE